jgi:hypothetical protein
MQKGLLDDLSSSRKLSLALDCWKSPNHYSFLAITGYFISDDWRYCEVLLAFKPLHGKHSAFRLAEYVMETLAFYNITKRLLTITADNVKNNNTLRKQLHKLLRKENIEWDYRPSTIRCMSHTIQLSVLKFLSVLKIQPPNDEPEKTSKKQRYDHISSEDIGYHNTYLKVCTTYHIDLLRYLTYFARSDRLLQQSIHHRREVSNLWIFKTQTTENFSLPVVILHKKFALFKMSQPDGKAPMRW